MEEGIPVVTFPQTMTRMGPATQRFFELVTNNRLWQDGNPVLAKHVGNAKIKTDVRGSRLVKDAPNSPRKIDACVAAVMAVDRAGYWLTQDAPDTFGGVPVKDIHFVWLEANQLWLGILLSIRDRQVGRKNHDLVIYYLGCLHYSR